MITEKLRILIIGLSITSSWGNGHATTYRALIRALSRHGHDVTFLERDVPWYAANRDLPNPSYCRTFLYSTLRELREEHSQRVQDADLVIIGSYVPDGIDIGEWICETATGVKAFYDIDTPVTLAKLESHEIDYLNHDLISEYDLYLSFTGGPILKTLESKYGAKRAEAFYCSVDPDEYYPENFPVIWDAGYLGTYSLDRQRTLDRIFLKAMRMKPYLSMIVAGPQYPGNILWPDNVQRIDHIPPDRHRIFYNSQRFAINITRDDMISAGYSPSVRLFEAAACGVPIITDYWAGIESIFVPEQEILIANSAEDVLCFLNMHENESRQIGLNARLRVLEHHTASHRASQLVSFATQSKAFTTSENYVSKNTA